MKIFSIKKLLQRYKPETHVSMATAHGTRCLLHVANLALFGVVIILTIASALIYYLMPVTDVSEQSKMIEAQEVETILDIESVNEDSKKEEVIENTAFSVISKRNVFSPERKEWIVKAVIPKAPALGKKKRLKKALAKKRALAGKPKKIVLHGIVIAGSIKKALINNPLTGVSKKKTVYVEEGDELEGYKVTSIEKDRIKLDWHGEEIVITLFSGLKGFKPGGNAGKVKPGGLTKLEYKYKVVDDAQAEESFDVGGPSVKNVAYIDMFDETSHYLVYKEPEYFSMCILNGVQLSAAVEMQEVAEKFPDIEFNGMGASEEGQEVVNAEIQKSVDDAQAEESFDVGGPSVKNVAYTDMLDETLHNLVYKEPEYFSMHVLDDAQLSETIEMQEVAEKLPDIELNDIGSSEEEKKFVNAEIQKSVDLPTEISLKQKAFSESPTEIILYGIVIASDTKKSIKKALINIPMFDSHKDRTLYVEVGDGLEGYKVTSIEKDRIKLNLYGEEKVVKFPPL